MIAGELAVPRSSATRGVTGLAGRSVAVVRGTTNAAAMREIDRLRRLGLPMSASQLPPD